MSSSNTSRRPSQINGSPLKIHKDSRLIHKPPTKFSAAIKGGVADQSRRNPVIIYTHSPTIIHTKPGDFMALVQSLTGMAKVVAAPDLNDNDVSSDLSDGGGGLESASPGTNHVINSIFGDFPLFTPNSSGDFFCSPRPVYRLSGGASPNSLSPSVMEFIKGLPEY